MEYQQIPEIIPESESEPEPDDPNDSDYVPVSSTESEEESPKLKTGQSTLNAVSKYQKANPDKCKEKCKRYYERLKANPERLQAFRAQQKLYRTKRKQIQQAEQL